MSPHLRLSGPTDVLAVTPYLMGFHPSDSLVALGVRGRGLRFHVRGDLPDERDDGEVLAEQYAGMFQRQRVDGVLLIGYGSAERAEPFMRSMRDAMLRRRIEVHEMLRAYDGRYWSLLCRSPECCPPEGREYDPTTSAAAVAATFAGMVALPDREAVVRTLAGPVGPALEAVEEATNRAGLRMLRLVDGRDSRDIGAAATRAGVPALDSALERYADGRRLTDDEVAWLVLLLHVLQFRDAAWRRIDRDGDRGREAHCRLWTDLVRRCEPGLAAPPAMLLAYLAWRSGDGLRASIAVDRALDADPGYSGARLMAEILARAVPPSALPPVGAHGRPPRRPRRRVAHRRKC